MKTVFLVLPLTLLIGMPACKKATPSATEIPGSPATSGKCRLSTVTNANGILVDHLYYDANHELIKEEIFNDTTGKLKSRYLFTLSDDGKTKNADVYVMYGNDLLLAEKTTEYRASSALADSSWLYINFTPQYATAEFYPEWLDHYTYDGNGNELTDSTFTPEGFGVGTEYTYDAQHRITSILSYSVDFPTRSTTVYSYNDQTTLLTGFSPNATFASVTGANQPSDVTYSDNEGNQNLKNHLVNTADVNGYVASYTIEGYPATETHFTYECN